MDNEMIVIKKVNIDQLIEQLQLFNENIKKLNGTSKEETFYTRDEAQEHYRFSKREIDKVFNTILKDKVVDIGKSQRLAKVHIDKMLTDGVTMKYV